MARRSGFIGVPLVLISLSVAGGDGIRVVNEGGIRSEWTLPPGAKLATPVYPAEHAAQQADACVAIGYLINPDGSTSDFALLKSWSATHMPRRAAEDYWAAFAQESAQALAQWRFQPRPEVPSPRAVYTVATMLFGAGATSAELRRHCSITDLAARLRELRADRTLRRQSGILDKLDLSTPADPYLREQ